MTMSDRKAVIKAWASQYRKAGKKEKDRILDELVALTGYNRCYVVNLLRWDGKVIRVGRRVRLIGYLRMKAKRTRQRLYDDAVLDDLKRIWVIMDCICGKRLAVTGAPVDNYAGRPMLPKLETARACTVRRSAIRRCCGK